MSLVSIAIASYNNAPYIDRCMESVINQTYSNLEILFVDDGSKDNTLEIITKYQNDRRVVIIEKENGGLSSVRQRALDEATGDFICFIDADDYLDPHYVECMLNKLIKDKSDICVCSTKFIDSSGNDLPRQTQSFSCEDSKEPFRSTASEFSIPNNSKISNLLLSDSWNKIYSVSFLRKCGVKFNMPKGLNGTDTSFNRRVALCAPLYSTIHEKLYIHVIYVSSAVHRKHKNLLLSYQLITEGTIEVSKQLKIYDSTQKTISTKYYSNLFEVLVDEYKENKGYHNQIKRLLSIKESHKSFVGRVGMDLNINNTALSIYVKCYLLLFEHLTFLLPPAMFVGRSFKKNIK